MAEFDAEARQHCGGVDDEPTAVAGVVVTFVGVRLRLDRAVDADVERQLPTPKGMGLSVDFRFTDTGVSDASSVAFTIITP